LFVLIDELDLDDSTSYTAITSWSSKSAKGYITLYLNEKMQICVSYTDYNGDVVYDKQHPDEDVYEDGGDYDGYGEDYDE
jgi:hypothetical protein